MSSTLGSYWGMAAMCWMRSWPDPAEIWEVIWPGTSAVLMWSTVTVTPTFSPQSRAKASNHSSWLGTKWLHIRMRRSPERVDAGSSNTVVDGAPTSSGAAVVGDASSPSPPQAPSTRGVMTTAPTPCRKHRRLQGQARGPRRTAVRPQVVDQVVAHRPQRGVVPAVDPLERVVGQVVQLALGPVVHRAGPVRRVRGRVVRPGRNRKSTRLNS